MKVKELIAELSEMDPESEVILQKDAEGNGYSPLRGADPDCVYVAENTWSGEVYSLEYTADDCCMEETEWEALKAGPKCVVLHPVN